MKTIIAIFLAFSGTLAHAAEPGFWEGSVRCGAPNQAARMITLSLKGGVPYMKVVYASGMIDEGAARRRIDPVAGQDILILGEQVVFVERNSAGAPSVRCME